MNINEGDRVQAITDSESAGYSYDGYFYRANETGVVVSLNEDGAWVQWDDNDRSDGIWHANFDNLRVIN